MKTDSFEADLRRALADRAAEVPGEAVERLQHRHYRPRTRGRAVMAGAGLAGVGAAVTALGIAMSQPTSHPGRPPATAQLAAWTVTEQADGTVNVAIRELINPAGIQSRLRAVGVPASVNIGGNSACQAYPRSAAPPAGQVFTFHQGQSRQATITSRHVTTIYIHPSALPSGAGVEISATLMDAPKHGLGVVVMHLVRTSQQCTGI
jgi:hypothetical protein